MVYDGQGRRVEVHDAPQPLSSHDWAVQHHHGRLSTSMEQ